MIRMTFMFSLRQTFVLFLFSGHALGGSLKGMDSFEAGMSTDEALGKFQKNGTPKTLENMRKVNSTAIEKFDKLECDPAKLEATTTNIIYSVHGKSPLLNAAKNYLVADGATGNQSILLLESDTNHSPRRLGLRRTLSKYGHVAKDVSIPKTIRGMDTNLSLRNLWWLPSLMLNIHDDPDKGLEGLLEEMISFYFITET